MKIPVALVTVLLSAILALEAWTLNAVVQLKADVAAINALVNHQPQNLVTK